MPAKQNWAVLKPVLPVASGGLHPRLVPALMETFGNDFVIQAGGGIHGHPDGTIAAPKPCGKQSTPLWKEKLLTNMQKTTGNSLRTKTMENIEGLSIFCL